MAESSYRQSFNSFSGVDMQVMAGGHLIAEIQGISYTVTREKAPLYTMGSADPRSFSRGKRGIAGSMIFLVFDRSALLHSLQSSAYYLANAWELTDSQTEDTPAVPEQYIKQFAANEDGTIGTVSAGAGSTLAGVNPNASGGNFQGLRDFDGKAIARARYQDQIPPFNIVISAANEYGHIARMEISNVEIMNCGSGMSIDDITTDESCTFVATSLVPWHRQAYVRPRDGMATAVENVPPRNAN